MFHWDRGLFLTAAQLALDVCRRQPRAFVSHAHSDHIGPHELALATPATARLYQHRLGTHRRTMEIAYREPVEFGPLRLTLLPAGHCLGSAMLLADDGQQTLLYTGDFKLGPSATCEEAELPHVDVLVMESTFGQPRYCLPPREEVIEQLLELVRRTLALDRTPVVHAYALGKSQEVTKILTAAGFPVMQHSQIFAVSEVYRSCGVDLGDVTEYRSPPPPGTVVVTLPSGVRGFRLGGIARPVSIAVTGWAIDSSTKYRYRVDHALPLTDHADFSQLLETVERVAPNETYCTHGPKEFVEHLRAAGHNAFPVTGSYQTRMF